MHGTKKHKNKQHSLLERRRAVSNVLSEKREQLPGDKALLF
jgi:hypothetical protein